LLEEVKSLKKNYKNLSSIPTVDTITNVLKRFFAETEGGNVIGNFIALALRGPGVNIPKIKEKLLLDSIFKFSAKGKFTAINQYRLRTIATSIDSGYYNESNYNDMINLLIEMYEYEILVVELKVLEKELKKVKKKTEDNISEAVALTLLKNKKDLLLQINTMKSKLEGL